MNVRQTVAIKDIPLEDRPRERLLASGHGPLKDAELLALVISTGHGQMSALGLAEQLLSQFHGLRGLAGASLDEMKECKGIGDAKSVQIVAALELGRRTVQAPTLERASINRPNDVAAYFMPRMRDLHREEFRGLMLNVRNKILFEITISTGGLDSSLVSPHRVFREALRANAASILLVHNHPSGDPTPSQEDLDVTRRLQEAGKIIGIDVVDHVIIGDPGWVSLKQAGKM